MVCVWWGGGGGVGVHVLIIIIRECTNIYYKQYKSIHNTHLHNNPQLIISQRIFFHKSSEKVHNVRVMRMVLKNIQLCFDVFFFVQDCLHYFNSTQLSSLKVVSFKDFSIVAFSYKRWSQVILVLVERERKI